jgi:hypothetical protein
MPYYGVVWTFQPVKRDELKKVLDKFNEGSIAGGDESPSVACIVKADTSSKALKNSYDIVLDSDAVAVDGCWSGTGERTPVVAGVTSTR